jgi:hypothetical protein
MGTLPAWREQLPLVEREVRAWVGWVEQLRGRLGRILGDEDHPRAGCRATKLIKCSDIRGEDSRIFNTEAYVD